LEIIAECMDDYLYVIDLQNNKMEISQSALDSLHMLCKHSAVFFVDNGHDLLLYIPHMCLRNHKPI